MALQLTKWRARIALTGLVVLFAWIFVHHALVGRYALDPWKFFGFAMYCQVTLPVEVVVHVDGRPEPLREDHLPRDGRAVVASYRRVRSLLGTLRPPSALAAWVFRTHPHCREVLIEVRHHLLDPGTDRTTLRTYPYRFRRPAG